MLKFRSLRIRLMVILSLVAFLSIGLVMGLMIWLQSRMIHTEWQDSLTSQARLLAHNSRAALEFGDPREATQLLSAVQANPMIAQVHLMANHGETVFAEYNNPQSFTGGKSLPHNHDY